MNFTTGDLFYLQSDQQYHLYKLLMDDAAFNCYHVLTYAPLDRVPVQIDVETLDIWMYHLPIDKEAFVNATLLTNQPIIAEDLIGYHEYLRQTKAPKEYIPVATAYYRDGLRLTDEKKYPEAIDAYSKAVDLFPQFYEAIDNRGFCKMDLGLWEDAIDDFHLSLEENPNSLLAEFSMGECYYKMGEYEKAKLHFEIAHQIDPNHQAPIQFLAKVKSILNQ
ncbi:tetratricopeptide repeat protein [Xanthocytophaga flava]|uniref:tetratricopeptide repeat protein n=1 Tax=Xanthocytophaga flava TaxID=3048013 RepID=UPI0028D405DA|nr:tetratricopeptide repeat protein [Xanthocytophaga flavus]MDJ1471538.1 tetratricopeptide repeat protein [Xanthocytophaga flavus]